MTDLAKCPYCGAVRAPRKKGSLVDGGHPMLTAPCQWCGQAGPVGDRHDRRINPPERRRASRRDRRGSSMATEAPNSTVHGSRPLRSADINVRSVAHREAALVAVAKRIPLLVTGTAVSISAVLDELNLLLPRPLTIVDCASTLSLNGGNGGTVILHNVDRCGIAAQRQLLEWLHLRPLGMQVVSTSSCSLFPLTATGAFLNDLYYRLNTVYVESAAA